MTATKSIAGGCACGSIRYRSTGEILFAAHCYCRDCQKATGTGQASFFILAKSETDVDGEPSTWMTTGESGNTVYRGFCETCGSPVYNTNTGYPENLFVHAATLDDPSLFTPERAVYRDKAQPWVAIDPSLP